MVLAYGRQAFKHEDKLKFWGGLIVEAVGGGKGLSDRLFEISERNEINILYETGATDLIRDEAGAVNKIRVKGPSGFHEISCKSVILACGGFEANQEMRTR